MRILWLSNIALSDRDNGGTGTWLSALAQGLVKSGEVLLGNISDGRVSKIARQDCGPICQWVVPTTTRLNRDGLPPENIVSDIVGSVDEFSPDLVHVWGTESFWGLLTARELIKKAAILEMQGLKRAIAGTYDGGLSIIEQLGCIGLKEIVRRSTLFQERKRFLNWGFFEEEMILNHQYIAVQTKWVETQVRNINPLCMTFKSDRMLRQPFYKAEAWQCADSLIIFCSAAYPAPFKGLHVAIRAVSLLKARFPLIKLRIAGALRRRGLRKDGYIAWLNREIKRNGDEQHIEWLGALSAEEIVEEMKMARVALIPSFMENCSNTMQEAMMVGIPVVASYVGGIPSLAREGESALFFPPGDVSKCAYQLERVFTDRALASELSRKARDIARTRNNREHVLKNQLWIYKNIFENRATA